jgi:hypothetical protein
MSSGVAPISRRVQLVFFRCKALSKKEIGQLAYRWAFFFQHGKPSNQRSIARQSIFASTHLRDSTGDAGRAHGKHGFCLILQLERISHAQQEFRKPQSPKDWLACWG